MLGGPPGAPWTADKNGSRDGVGSGDHDQPFRYGGHLSVRAHLLFTDRVFARLLCLRSHIQDGDRVPEILVMAAPDRFGLSEPDPDEMGTVLDPVWGDS